MKTVYKEKDGLFYTTLLDKNVYLPLILYLVTFSVRFLFLAISDNLLGAEPMQNLITSLHILKFPSMLDNIDYLRLPFYLYSVALSVLIGQEQIFSARFLSLFFGSLTVIPFYNLVKTLFDKKIAILSSLILCFYPVHILKSIVSLPDVSALFFIISGLYFIANKKIVFAAVFFAIACGYSYLAWIVCLVVIFSLLLEDYQEHFKRNKSILVFFLIIAIFPIIWSLTVKSKYAGYDIFYKNLFTQGSLFGFLFAFMLNVQILIKNLIFNLNPGIFLLGMAGVVISILRKKNYGLIFWIGALVLFAACGIFRYEIPIITEAVLLLSLLCIPFVIGGIFFGLALREKNNKKFIWLPIFFICLMLFCNMCWQIPVLPDEIKDVSSWIGRNITAEDLIFIEKDKQGYFSSIIMLSGLPQGNFYYLDKNIWGKINIEVEGKDVYFIVLPKQKTEQFNKALKEVISFKTYKLYKINKS